MGLRDITIYHMLEYNALMYGSQPAVIGIDKTVSHSEFLQRVNRLAEGLNQHGIEKGDRICILAQNSMEYLRHSGLSGFASRSSTGTPMDMTRTMSG